MIVANVSKASINDAEIDAFSLLYCSSTAGRK